MKGIVKIKVMTNIIKANFFQAVCSNCKRPINLQTAKKDKCSRYCCDDCLHDSNLAWRIKFTLVTQMMQFIKEQKGLDPIIIKAIGDKFWELL
jgi:hypothetical protein